MNPFSNHEAEVVLLASLLEHPEAYHQALSMGLRAEHFSEEQPRLVFRSMVQLGEAGHPVSFETVLSEIQKAPNAERMTAVLEDLTNPLHVPRKDVEWHVKQLQDKARRRRLRAACKRTADSIEDPSEGTNDCIEYLQESLLDIQADSISRQASPVKAFMAQVLRALELRASHQGLIGLHTGITDLDEATTGIRPGELWVIGAMSGRGKTALGAQIALASASAGDPAVFFSLEMTIEDLGSRFLCNESSVSASRIRNPRFINKQQWTELATCAGRMAEWPLHIDDSSSLNTQALLARARLYIRRYGCRLVVVDYIRLIRAAGRELREQVGNATDALRQLAKTEHVAVVALSQLARPKDRNLNGRPTMLGLKESGDIEAHAHVVLLIHMPIKKGEPTGEDEIIIGKNRHGPIGSIEVTFDRERLKFLPRSHKTASNESGPALFQEGPDDSSVVGAQEGKTR